MVAPAIAPTTINPRQLPNVNPDGAPIDTPDAFSEQFVSARSQLLDGSFEIGQGGAPDPAMVAAWSRDRNKAGRYKFMYWRKPDLPDGTWNDVVIASNIPTDFMAHVEAGWTPLRDFGRFDRENPVTPWGQYWDTRTDPYRLLLMNPNAYKAVSLRQALEMGWHRIAALKNNPGWAQLFAQWLGKDEKCERCGRVFKSLNDIERHTSVMHGKESANDSLVRAMLAQGSAQSAPMTELVKGFTSAIERMGERQSRTDNILAAALQLLVGAKPGQEPEGVLATEPADAETFGEGLVDVDPAVLAGQAEPDAPSPVGDLGEDAAEPQSADAAFDPDDEDQDEDGEIEIDAPAGFNPATPPVGIDAPPAVVKAVSAASVRKRGAKKRGGRL